MQAAEKRPPVTTAILLSGGFARVGHWALHQDGPPRPGRDSPARAGVDAFARGDEVLYVGVGSSGLLQRLRGHARSGPTQRTNIRVGGMLRAALAEGRTIDISAARGYAASQRIRKRIEEGFGWTKTVAGLYRPMVRGVERVGWAFTFAAAAYNLVRLPKLLVEAT